MRLSNGSSASVHMNDNDGVLYTSSSDGWGQARCDLVLELFSFASLRTLTAPARRKRQRALFFTHGICTTRAAYFFTASFVTSFSAPAPTAASSESSSSSSSSSSRKRCGNALVNKFT